MCPRLYENFPLLGIAGVVGLLGEKDYTIMPSNVDYCFDTFN